ncbi:TcaA NTF2-like domain-containing protein [Sporosarcina trichiuri]|uniref:TcaA NTF2-like domain-containing protein n=1 Tax=Sporosarcina trichiuri TaxID=3056445 RepID=UPI003D6742FC
MEHIFNEKYEEKRIVRGLTAFVVFLKERIFAEATNPEFTIVKDNMDTLLKEWTNELKPKWETLLAHQELFKDRRTAITELEAVPLDSKETFQALKGSIAVWQGALQLELVQTGEWEDCDLVLSQNQSLSSNVRQLTEDRDALMTDYQQLCRGRRQTKSEWRQIAVRQAVMNDRISTLQEQSSKHTEMYQACAAKLKSYLKKLNEQLNNWQTESIKTLNRLENEWESGRRTAQIAIGEIEYYEREAIEATQQILHGYQMTLGSLLSDQPSETVPSPLRLANAVLMGLSLCLPIHAYESMKTWHISIDNAPEADIKSSSVRLASSLFSRQSLPIIPDVLDLPVEERIQRISRRQKRRFSAAAAVILAATAVWQKEQVIAAVSPVVESTAESALSVFQMADAFLNRDDEEDGGYDYGEAAASEDTDQFVENETQAYDDHQAAMDTGNSIPSSSVDTTADIVSEPAPEQQTEIAETPSVPVQAAPSRQVTEETARQLSDFILNFRVDYEDAVNYGEFGYVAHYLAQGSKAYEEIEEYILGIQGKGTYFEFESTDILDTGSLNARDYYVDTEEVFLFTGNEGDQWRYVKGKRYIIRQDDDGYARITDLVSLKNDKIRIDE